MADFRLGTFGITVALLGIECGLHGQLMEQTCTCYNPPTVSSPATQKHNSMKRMKQSRKAGFTLVEIMIVVAIIGLLAAIAIPNFVKARATSQQNACINNMRQITAAVNEWALETGQQTGSSAAAGAQTTFQPDLSPYIQLNSNSSIPPCPANGSYTTANVGVLPQVTCSLSTLPSQPHKSP